MTDDHCDAMTTLRPYKPALTIQQAWDEIEKNRGSQCHPDLCDIFLDLYGSHHQRLETLAKERNLAQLNGYAPYKSRLCVV